MYMLLIIAQIFIVITSLLVVKQVKKNATIFSDNKVLIEKKINYYKLIILLLILFYLVVLGVLVSISKLELIIPATAIFTIALTCLFVIIDGKDVYKIDENRYVGHMPAFSFKYFGKIPMTSIKTFRYSNMNHKEYVYKKLSVIKLMPIMIMLYLGYALVIYDTQKANYSKAYMEWIYTGIIFITLFFILWVRSSLKRIRIAELDIVDYKKLERMELLNFIRVIISTIAFIIIVSLEPVVPGSSLETTELIFNITSKFLLISGVIGFILAIIYNRYSFFYPSIMRNLEVTVK